MSTQTRLQAEQQEARRNFLVTGARSFLQGTAAMAKFHREVYHGCRKALENQLPALEKALAMKLDARAIIADPDTWDLADPAESVGARLWIENWGNIYSYCWWRYGEDGEEPVVSAVASIESAKAATRQQWEQALKSVDPRVDRDERELWIEQVLSPDAFGDFESALNELLGSFAALLAKAKGRLKPTG
jgi:hypothetical protein